MKRELFVIFIGASRSIRASYLAPASSRQVRIHQARPRQARPGSRGFVLFEVLVAAAIAAIALAVLFEGASTGLAAARQAGRMQQALALARSRLAAAMALPPSVRMLSGATTDSMRWHLQVRPAETLPPTPAQPAMTLYRVGVVVAWGDGAAARQVRLESALLGSAPGR